MTDVAAKLAVPARWLMVVGIAYTLATSVLYFLSPPVSAPVATAPSAAPSAASAERRPAVDVNGILARNLFGTADAQTEAVVSNQPAPVTRLPLELLGVFVADDPDSSAAIISQRGRPGMLYAVGDDVPGNAALLEVHSDHVVLRRAGVRESLHFPELSESLAARAPVAAPEDFDAGFVEESEPGYDDYGTPFAESEPDAEEATLREMVDEYREEMGEDPSAALEELGMSPVTEGAAEGYRVGDLAQSPYLSQTGLQPGDVILSVNGRPVGDLEQDRLELDNVLAEGSARLEVQRGTRRFFVTATLQ